MTRLFISYRSSDGKKDASRLAEDLSEIFGEQTLFYDKHNLHGGRSWREQVKQTLGAKPFVLVLLTPDYFGAVEDGTPRIQREDDPVRQELLAAFDARATVLPLLTEGVTMPKPATLPADLAPVTEAHALKLRTEDWRTDLARLVRDLQALGLAVTDDDVLRRRGLGTGETDRSGSSRGYKWLGWAAGLGLLFAMGANEEKSRETVLGLALFSLLPLWLAWRGHRLVRNLPGTMPRVWSWATLVWCGFVTLGLVGMAGNLQADASPEQADATPATPTAVPQPPLQPAPQPAAQLNEPQPVNQPDVLTGGWTATMANGMHLPFTLVQRGEQVSLSTTRLDVRNDASFAPMNQWLLHNRGFMVEAIRVRGDGRLDNGAIELRLQMTDGEGQRTLDQGSMTLAVAPGGQALEGSLHFSSGTPTVIRLVRQWAVRRKD